MANDDAAVSMAEAKTLFAGLRHSSGVVLAVSGGPDSVALMWLIARWRAGRTRKPKLVAITVDHGLRAESRREALTVARLARRLGIPHRIVRWTGRKPSTGLPQAARKARYRLLIAAARKEKASHILTAHTRDDQAETVIMRMARGSGITGLAAMARETPLDGLMLARPLLDVSKVRLVATLAKAGIGYADDPTNRDPRFTRARLRRLMPELAGEGLDARRLAQLAGRMRRADEALEAATDGALADVARGVRERGSLTFDADGFLALPAEIGLRLLRRAIDRVGDEGPVELGKLEHLLAAAALAAQNRGKTRFRHSLAGAIVTIAGGRITVERAPARRRGHS